MQFQRFLADLRAGISMGVPLEYDRTSAMLTGKKIDRLQAGIPADATRLQAAVRAFEATDSMIPVLEGLSLPRAARKLAVSTFQWMILYVSAVLLAAIGGLLFFLLNSARAMDHLVADALPNDGINRNEDLYGTAPFVWVVAGIAVIAVVLVIWLLLARRGRLAMLLGGGTYVRRKMTAGILRQADLLATSGVDPKLALETCCELFAADEQTRKGLEAVCGGNSSSVETELPSELIPFFEFAANQQLLRMKTTIPLIVVTITGISIGLYYCVAILGPVFRMLENLGGVGI